MLIGRDQRPPLSSSEPDDEGGTHANTLKVVRTLERLYDMMLKRSSDKPTIMRNPRDTASGVTSVLVGRSNPGSLVCCLLLIK